MERFGNPLRRFWDWFALRPSDVLAGNAVRAEAFNARWAARHAWVTA